MIVDASVAFKWLAPEEDTELAIDLLNSADLLAPTLLLIEVANGLWKKGQRDQIDQSVSFAQEIENVAQMATMVDEAGYIPRALELARELDHPVYDCVYLAMAEKLADRMVTADVRFLNKIAQSAYARHVVTLAEAAK